MNMVRLKERHFIELKWKFAHCENLRQIRCELRAGHRGNKKDKFETEKCRHSLQVLVDEEKDVVGEGKRKTRARWKIPRPIIY